MSSSVSFWALKIGEVIPCVKRTVSALIWLDFDNLNLNPRQEKPSYWCAILKSSSVSLG